MQAEVQRLLPVFCYICQDIRQEGGEIALFPAGVGWVMGCGVWQGPAGGTMASIVPYKYLQRLSPSARPLRRRGGHCTLTDVCSRYRRPRGGGQVTPPHRYFEGQQIHDKKFHRAWCLLFRSRVFPAQSAIVPAFSGSFPKPLANLNLSQIDSDVISWYTFFCL